MLFTAVMQLASRQLWTQACRAAVVALATLVVLFAIDAIADPPEVAEILEPAIGSAALNPEDVHMVAEFTDADGDAHLCSDWEIWALDPLQPVWRAHCVKAQEKVHIHLGDGEFVNSYAGRLALEHDAAYELRVRFRDGSGEAEEWSEWQARQFSTASAGPRGNDAPVPWAPRPGFAVEVAATGFQLPVNIAMVPEPGPHPSDPLYYVAELYGAIKVVSRDGTVRDYATGLLNFNPTGAFPGSGEQGLAGLAVDPASGDLFASLVYEDESSPLDPEPHYPKVIRLHSDERGLSATAVTTVLDMVGETQGPSHQVSHVAISPGGELFVHNGDGFDAFATARDLESFRGKILRMGLGGEPLPDNPYYDAGNGVTARDYVWASGFRNPFGAAWRLSDGSYYEVENGPATDRLVRVSPGGDYLWDGNDATMSFGASYNWHPSVAPVNIEFVEPGRFAGSGFPAQSMGHAFVTESGPTWASGPQLSGKRIVEFDLAQDGTNLAGPTTLAEYSGTGKATAVGLAAGSDGLYFTDLYKDQGYSSPIDAGANVLRISYCGENCPKPSVAVHQPEPSQQAAVRPDPGPRVKRFRLLRGRFAVSLRRRSTARPVAPIGTTFLYSLSMPATVRIEIRSRTSPAHFVLAAPGRAGGNRRAFGGHIGRRTLAPGPYVATIVVLGASGEGPERASTRFQVVRG